MEDRSLNDYHHAREYLFSFIDYERHHTWKYDARHFDLGRLRSFLAHLDDPHLTGRFAHVAGTNGKGTVAAMIAKGLTAAGMRIGLYTSPHLATFRERIRLDGSLIPREAVVAHVKRLRAAAGDASGLTFFDVWTALAFDWLAAKKVDASVIEVGMGGRLDSTNVITPDVSIITPIALEHRQRLGDTISEIAFEKAGVIKPGIPVVVGHQNPDAREILLMAAEERDAPVFLAEREYSWRATGDGIHYHGPSWSLENVRVPLSGVFQLENAATAIAALEVLASRGLPVSEDAARAGIETVKWPGRLQQIADSPSVVVDGACNPAAMTVVRDYIQARSERTRTVAVVGMCADKDVREVLGILGEAAGRFIYTRAGNPRDLKPDDLAALTPRAVAATVEPDPLAALDKAMREAGEDGMVIVTGSLYLVGLVVGERAFESIEHI